jgi:hypothetical protein
MIVREVKAGQNGVLGKALQDDRVIVCVDVVGPAGPNIGSYDYHSLFQSPVSDMTMLCMPGNVVLSALVGFYDRK